MTKPDVATYEEALKLLSEKARAGDVRAQIALAGHLRKERHDGDQKPGSAVDELAKRRAA